MSAPIGIYKIEVLGGTDREDAKGRTYYGQSKDVEKRWKSHRKNSSNTGLKAAMDQFGRREDCFNFQLLHETTDQIEANLLEISLIENDEARLNKAPGGELTYIFDHLQCDSCGTIFATTLADGSDTYREDYKPGMIYYNLEKTKSGRMSISEFMISCWNCKQKHPEYKLCTNTDPLVGMRLITDYVLPNPIAVNRLLFVDGKINRYATYALMIKMQKIEQARNNLASNTGDTK